VPWADTRETTKMDGYEVRVHYSADDECYVAEIVEFVGGVADGPTPEEALTNLRELKEVWMRAVVENGYAIPPPRHVAVRLRQLTVA